MQTFLTKVELQRFPSTACETLTREWGLIEAEDLGQAEAIAQIQVDKDNSGDWVAEEHKFWRKTGDVTIVKLRTTEPIDDDEAQTLQKYGMAYYINRETV